MMGHQEVPSLIVGQRKEVYYKIIDLRMNWQFYARTIVFIRSLFLILFDKNETFIFSGRNVCLKPSPV